MQLAMLLHLILRSYYNSNFQEILLLVKSCRLYLLMGFNYQVCFLIGKKITISLDSLLI